MKQLKQNCTASVFRCALLTLLCLAVASNSEGQDIATANRAVKGTDSASKNIIILLADDLGWGDISLHGGNAETANIDQLAEAGVELTRFYAFPACSPARAAMLTGRFPQRYGIVGPVTPKSDGLPTSELLLPAGFKKSGYQTSLIGKWHLGESDEPKSHPLSRGFDHFYGFMSASIDYYSHTGSRGKPDWQRDGNQVTEDGYSTDLLADEAIRQIENRDPKKRLCMTVSFNAPHSPFQAPAKLIAKYSPYLGERDGTYAAMLEALDLAIGRILTSIDEQGLRDETIVVFTSDNGAARMGSNSPFRGRKREVYEGGIHVPFLIRAPGVLTAGTKSDQLSAIYDLFPTLATACNVSLPVSGNRPLDGRSIWAELVDGQSTNRTLAIAEEDFTLINNDWKLIQLNGGTQELYGLKTDIAEARDQFAQQQQITTNMSKQLVAFQQNVADDKPATELNKQPATNTETAESGGQATTLREGEELSNAKLNGDAIYGVLGDPRVESNGLGVRLLSGVDHNGDGTIAAEAKLPAIKLNSDQRWYRFYISGMAQDNFAVDKDELYLKVEFFQNNGAKSLDLIKTRFYSQVLRERKDLKDAGTNKNLGDATWQNYAMDFRTPFAEIDTLKLSVGLAGGTGGKTQSEFWVRSMNVAPIAIPANYQKPIASSFDFPQPAVDSLVHIGGRWYFDPKGKNRSLPEQFDHTNSDQLLYKSDRFEAPFASNMSSWLRPGYLDIDGKKVVKDVYKPDSLVITVSDQHIVMRSRNLPNHPTATFPDRWRMLDGDPAHIKEQAMTWHIPINPKLASNPVAMTPNNDNKALQGGPIGVATNGVVFFNPFDHIFETDAVWRLDRCCGHPSPQNVYHYHKYPVCVKTPWSDEGQAHSNVIGFAFDGFPVYGPYESKGLLARDDTANPLNDFNVHEDAKRGPHYHVTPGKFPHIIGGYWGELDPLNRRRRPETGKPESGKSETGRPDSGRPGTGRPSSGRQGARQ